MVFEKRLNCVVYFDAMKYFSISFLNVKCLCLCLCLCPYPYPLYLRFHTNCEWLLVDGCWHLAYWLLSFGALVFHVVSLMRVTLFKLAYGRMISTRFPHHFHLIFDWIVHENILKIVWIEDTDEFKYKEWKIDDIVK